MEFDATIAEQIPQEYRDHAFVKDAPDLPTLVKNAVETKNTLGNIQRTSIRIPDKDAKPEDAQKWWTDTRGKLAERGFMELPPSTPEEYKLPAIEGFTPDEGLTQSYIKDVAHATGMTPKQVEANLKFHHQMNQQAAKELLVSREAADQEFKTMMGNDYGTVMESVNTAYKALQEDFPQFGEWSKRAFVLSVDANGKPGKAYPLDSHPMVRGLLELIGNMTREDHSEGAPPLGGETEDSIDAKIKDIRENKENPLHTKFWANDDEAVKKVQDLYRMKAAVLKSKRSKAA